VSAGNEHTMGIRTNGTLWAWGNNMNLRAGLGVQTPVNAAPAQVGTYSDWVIVSARNQHTMGIREDAYGNRTLWGWGNRSDGRINGVIGAGGTQLPERVGTGTDWAYVSVGSDFTMGIREDAYGNRTLWGWGSNTNMRLGTGAAGGISQRDPLGDWAYLSVGLVHTMAIRKDGSLWAWGEGTFGRRGDGSTAASPIVRVGTEYDWVSVSGGVFHSVAIREGGSLWIWGNRSQGRIGDGEITGDQLTPIRIEPNYIWRFVSTGGGHTAAIREDGTLWTWGNGPYDQLGNGTTGSTRPLGVYVEAER